MRTLTARFLASLCMACMLCTVHAQTLRIYGATTVSPPIKDAAEILKKDKGITLQISPEISSNADKIFALGNNLAEVAMLARPLTAADRAPFPDLDFKQIQIGAEAAAIAVSKDVWDAGVHFISKAQARDIYEGKIKNWNALGGPDCPIVGFLPEHGHGVWACYVQWIYEDPSSMKANRFAAANSDEEAQADLESTAGAFSAVSLLYGETHHLNMLAIRNDNGKLAQPVIASVADHTYPMARPMILVVKGRPLGDIKEFVQFMLGDQGQQLVRKYNYLPLKELGIAPEVR